MQSEWWKSIWEKKDRGHEIGFVVIFSSFNPVIRQRIRSPVADPAAPSASGPPPLPTHPHPFPRSCRTWPDRTPELVSGLEPSVAICQKLRRIPVNKQTKHKKSFKAFLLKGPWRRDQNGPDSMQKFSAKIYSTNCTVSIIICRMVTWLKLLIRKLLCALMGQRFLYRSVKG